MNLTKYIPVDKLLHLLVGASVASVLFPALNGGMAIAGVIVLGALKEIWDSWSGKGTSDMWDFLVTLLGGLLALAAEFLLLGIPLR